MNSLNSRYTPEQQTFLRSIAGKGYNQLTQADRAEAARVGLSLPTMSYPKSQPLPANPTFNDIRRCW